MDDLTLEQQQLLLVRFLRGEPFQAKMALYEQGDHGGLLQFP
jgi:hypothetical protein